MPERIQLRRTKGWRMPANTVNVARPGRLGNPFRVDLLGRERAIDLLRDACQGSFSPGKLDDLTDEQFRIVYEAKERWRKRLGHPHPLETIWSLRGQNVACWCALDEACHGDVYLELANS